MKKIICFGEVLWDVFPTHKKIGGAPLNVAVRLKSFGNDVAVVSKVGQDEDGQKIFQFLKEKKVDTKHLQQDSVYKTGSVAVLLDESGSASYTIDFPRAWDYIDCTEDLQKEVELSDAVIYGSLAARNLATKESLMTVLKLSKFKVFDVNLRAPHYTKELLNELMLEANVIKFNDEEILEIAGYLGSESQNMRENMQYIAKSTKTETICVTRGGDGAILYTNDQFYDHPGYRVNVVNTVGAGDSFLATLIHCLLLGEDPYKTVDLACIVGGLVTQSEGANPELSMEEIQSFPK